MTNAHERNRLGSYTLLVRCPFCVGLGARPGIAQHPVCPMCDGRRKVPISLARAIEAIRIPSERKPT